MDTIKLIAPEGVTCASVEGQSFDVAADRTVTVPAAYALQLYGFGFGNAPAEPEKTAEQLAAEQQAKDEAEAQARAEAERAEAERAEAERLAAEQQAKVTRVPKGKATT